jgi:Ran GTPase-activating protein (RanGAP) involved in mRNA processing and transport
MSKISRLKKLNLSNNYLDTEGFSIISDLLASAPLSLTDLQLQSCFGSAQAIKNLSCGLKVNKSLLSLDLRGNEIRPEGALALAEVLTLNKLKVINLTDCQLGPEGAQHLFAALASNNGLETLHIGDNNIGDAPCEALGLALESNRTIRHLVIMENNISDEGVALICRGLQRNRSLCHLGVQWNPLTNKSARSLGDALKGGNSAGAPPLRSLHILGTGIDSDGVGAIVEGSLYSSAKAVELDVAGTTYQQVNYMQYKRVNYSYNSSRPSTAPGSRPASASRRTSFISISSSEK